MLLYELAYLIRQNPDAKMISVPHMNLHFPDGIRPFETSDHAIRLYGGSSGMYVELDLRSFSTCYLRANEIVIF